MDWHKTFDRLLPPFAEGKREKPRDMLYLASDRPPWSTTLSVSIQHVIVALMLLIYSVIAGQTMGLAGAQLRDFLALGMLVIGFGTVLNGLTTRFSAGHLLVNLQGPLSITIFITVVESSGPGAASGVLVAALMTLILGRFLPQLRVLFPVLFPAEVSGVLLVLLGIVPVGTRRATGLAAGTLNPLDPSAVLIAAVTLGTIFGLAVWSPGRARILALLIGAAAGLLMAVLTGVLGSAELARVAQPVFALPGEYYRPAPPTWVPAAIVLYLLGSIMAAVDTVGSGVMIDKMNNERWS